MPPFINQFTNDYEEELERALSEPEVDAICHLNLNKTGDVITALRSLSNVELRCNAAIFGDCPDLIHQLRRHDINMTCNSMRDLLHYEKAMGSVENLMWDHAFTPASTRKTAMKNGVSVFAVDSASQIAQLAELVPPPAVELYIRAIEGAHDEIDMLLGTAATHHLAVVGVCFAPDEQEHYGELDSVYLMLAASHYLERAALLNAPPKITISGLLRSTLDLEPLAVFFASVPSASKLTLDISSLLRRTGLSVVTRVTEVEAVSGSQQVVLAEGVFTAFPAQLGEEKPQCVARVLNKRTPSTATVTTLLGPTGDEMDLVAAGLELPCVANGDWIIISGIKVDYAFLGDCQKVVTAEM